MDGRRAFFYNGDSTGQNKKGAVGSLLFCAGKKKEENLWGNYWKSSI